MEEVDEDGIRGLARDASSKNCTVRRNRRHCLLVGTVVKKREAVDDIPFDKRRKIGAGKTALPTSTVRTRQAFEKEKLRSALESSEKKCSDTDDRDRQVSQVQALTAEIGKCEETMGKYQETLGKYEETIGRYQESSGKYQETLGKYEETIGRYQETLGKYEETIGRYQESSGKSQEIMRKGLTELDLMATKSKSLEKTCLSQRERIRLLEHLLTAANDRLKASQQLRGELQLVRDDRDSQVSKVQALTATIVKYQETIGKCLPELDLLSTKSKSSQRESIRILEQQLTEIAANEK
ncbi:hypothetical protein LWI29_007968 [Acer saccharum]|uniref:Uncharacterized protein n=1 Tax=Acer saccharum TaxID=4024 RepID=A0AA39T1C9_ACESA|nr:hypothetical protein LWI29_007968 [Acer saccharum]